MACMDADCTHVPLPLRRKGFIDFNDADASTCFEAYRDWSDGVASRSDRLGELIVHLGLFYTQLNMRRDRADASAPNPNRSEPTFAWIDPCSYVLSDALLDGFFASERNWVGALPDRAVDNRGYWSQMAKAMAGEGGSFNTSKAAKRMEVERIEIQRAPDGRFMHVRESGGRHRTVAMLALRAPALPAILWR